MIFYRCAVFSLLFGYASSRGIERTININNFTGRKFEVHWIHPHTNELVKQSTSAIFNGATFTLNSFVSHAFAATEVPHSKTQQCSGVNGTDACANAYFAVTDSDNQVINVLENFVVQHLDDASRARNNANEVTSVCEKMAKKKVDSLRTADMNEIKVIMEAMSVCIEDGVAQKIEKLNDEISFQASVRTSMGGLLEDYTCDDHGMPSTTPVETKVWRDKIGRTRNVDVMLERDSAKIHFIKEFISEEECQAVKNEVGDRLYVATVANESGGSRVSPNRKALQGSIRIPWQNDGAIARVGHRIYEYTNQATWYNLGLEGQEDLMIIKYNGRGRDEEEPDRYMPHCDGDCTGLPQKIGNRVATLVMYCDVPEVGGATNFRNSNVHVVPEKGGAVFFSYMGSDKIMDTGFTEHSGCPVIEGEKMIITQWMRYGVDNKNPWDSFNTRKLHNTTIPSFL